MSYDIDEHRHRFAVWAAARASQRGFTTVGHLREALQATDIRKVLSDPHTLQFSADQFNDQHYKWCSAICATLSQRSISNISYGRAATLLAVYLKVTVIMGERCDSALGRNLHPPIDRILLHGLAASDKIMSPHKAAWRSLNWTQLDESAYTALIVSCEMRFRMVRHSGPSRNIGSRPIRPLVSS